MINAEEIATIYFNRASALNSLGKAEAALAELRYALNADSSHRQSLELKDLIESREEKKVDPLGDAEYDENDHVRIRRVVFGETESGSVVEIPATSEGLVINWTDAPFYAVEFNGNSCADVYFSDMDVLKRWERDDE